MKKKVKLIATLSSLGLALAMLVFAVYAATSVTFKVTTNVSFEATKHVQATIVAKDTGKLASAPTNASYTVSAKTGGNQTIGVNPDGTDNGSVTDVEFVGAELDATNKYYGYQITITNNDNENKLPVTVTIPEHTGTGYTVTYKVNGTKVNAGKNVVEVPENKDGQNNVYVITCDVVITDLAGNAVTINKEHLNIEKVFLGQEVVDDTYILEIEFVDDIITQVDASYLTLKIDNVVICENEDLFDVEGYYFTDAILLDVSPNAEVFVSIESEGLYPEPGFGWGPYAVLNKDGKQVENYTGDEYSVSFTFTMSSGLKLEIDLGNYPILD